MKLSFKIIVLACALLIQSLYLFISNTRADALDDVATSPEMQKYSPRRPPLGSKLDQAWFKKGSNFAMVFDGRSGAGNLITWATPPSSKFYSGKQVFKARNEYAYASKFYKDINSQVDVLYEIIVAHPKYSSMVDYRLIKEFLIYEPPNLDILGKEEMKINSLPATLFTKKAGGCSLLLKLPQRTLVNLSVKDCHNSDLLIALAEALDLARLQKKLAS